MEAECCTVSYGGQLEYAIYHKAKSPEPFYFLVTVILLTCTTLCRQKRDLIELPAYGLSCLSSLWIFHNP